MSNINTNKKRRASFKKTSGPRDLAVQILVQVAESGAYSNLQLNQALQEANLPRPDAALATELVYGTIQRQLTLDYWLEQMIAKGFHKLQPWVLQLLRISLYQLVFLDRIPAHAAVNEAVKIARKRGHSGVAGMVNGVLRNAERNLDKLHPELISVPSAAKQASLRYSYTEEMVQRWIDAYGEETAIAICRSGNEAPHASIRVNPLMNSKEETLAQLRSEGMEAEPSLLAGMGIVVRGGGHLAEHKAYRMGKWTLQDESSMIVAEAAAPAAGMKVLDCCAAPGGKSTHLAELMEGKGKVWANDLHPHKRELIVAQSERLKLRNVEAVTTDAMQLAERFPAESMDVVLLDAPCSGLGVIRRKPEIKWTKSIQDIASIAQLQAELLQSVAPLVRHGGALIYSTCTIEKEENELQVQRFLRNNSGFKLDPNWPSDTLERLRSTGAASDDFSGMIQILPQYANSDGFFIARLVREQ